MTATNPFRRMPPPVVLAAVALVCGLAVAATVLALVLRQPWLGVGLRVDDGRIVVASVHPAGPAARAGLEPQRPLAGWGGLEAEPVDLVEEPDMLGDHAAFDRFMARQDLIARALRAPGGIVLDSGGQSITLVPDAARPPGDLPAAFWAQLGVGLFGFWVGAWVCALRREGWAEFFLFLAGAGLMLSAHAAAIYSTRELALPAPLFRPLSSINHLGAMLFGAAMIGLFLSHPVRMVRGGWLAVPGVVLLSWWGANQLRLFPDPAIGFQLPVALALLAIAVCVVLQWRATRHDPRARAALRWFGLSVLIGAGSFIVTIILPILLGLEAVLSQGLAFLFFLPIYGGLALGVARYRLFDLEDWGFRILFYMGGVVLLVTLDAALVLLIAVDRVPAFGVALLAVSLLYLPLRERLAERLLQRRTRTEGRVYRAVADVALTPPGQSRAARWQGLLQAEFDPLRIEPRDEGQGRVTLGRDGATLDLPGVDRLPPLRLHWARGGRALFSPRDVARAEDMIAMLSETAASRRAYEQGAVEERARIARDMHDNIGIQLMGALHSASADRKDALIRETLSDLRDILSNTSRGDLPTVELLADLRASLAETTAAVGVELDWQEGSLLPERLLPRQAHALRSVLREAVGNALRHSGSPEIRIRIDADADGIEISVADSGRGMADPAEVGGGRGGNGLGNMRARAAGLGGMVDIHSAPGKGTIVRARLPLRIEPERQQA